MNQAQHRLLLISPATTLKAMPFMTTVDAWRIFLAKVNKTLAPTPKDDEESSS